VNKRLGLGDKQSEVNSDESGRAGQEDGEDGCGHKNVSLTC
jgi:hypothetical protein